ncbi:nuclear transport factor 2 family protein [Embleya sp. NBC_00896]|uniref:nuclear transport factor 2 family protein n=1 Tax=Embleya sp. NBC_00896 TaxID=2975961 RepID=UPI002F90F28A|nr:nuclear transport factor 2 family protein [Embleya sp. NBC_00896]
MTTESVTTESVTTTPQESDAPPAPPAPPVASATSAPSALSVLETFFAAEAVYVEGGGRGKASFADLAACLSPDVVMYQAPGLPYGGERHGPSGIEDFVAALSEAWREFEFLEQRFVVDGDTVVILNRARLTARSTGHVLETWLMQMMTVRDGLIVEIRPFYWDTKAVDAALGVA